MEHPNGDSQLDAWSPSARALVVSQGATESAAAAAPAYDPAQSLDPSGLGKLVEHEVKALLDAAEADAARIRSKALAGVRMAEAKVTSLQQQMESTLAQLGELAGRIEAASPIIDPTEAAPSPKVETVETSHGREPVAPNIPPSDEVVRLLREHLT